MSEFPQYRYPDSAEGDGTEVDAVVTDAPPERSRRRLLLIIGLVSLGLVGAIGLVAMLGAGRSAEVELEEAAVDPTTGTESEPSNVPKAEPDGDLELLIDDSEVVTSDAPRSADDERLPRASEPSEDEVEPGSAEAATTGTGASTTTAEPATSITPETPPPTVAVEPPPAGVTQVAYAVDATLMVFDEPDKRVSWALPNPTQFGGPRVVTVLGTSPDKAWHKVSVPVQPNGTVGWVRAEEVRIESHEFRARVALGSRRVQVWDGDSLVSDTGAVIGKSSTPTPLGTFFVRDIIPQSYTGGAYGPWIIALSGFSEAMDTFNGGLPAIAVHGTNRPDLIGSAASNGCIRIPNDVVTLLAQTVPLGTPVEVIA